MRHFDLLNIQHVMLYLFPTLVFMILFGLALGGRHWRGPDSETRKNGIVHRFPEGIEERNAPFPLAMGLLIAGTLIWGLFYILGIAWFGVQI